MKKTQRTAMTDAALGPPRLRDVLAARRERRERQEGEALMAKRKARAKITRSSGNVFEDLGFPAEHAEHLRVRSALMGALRQVIQERGLTQADAASLLGVSQPRISDLVRGKIALFSIDALVEMLARAGYHVELRVAQVT